MTLTVPEASPTLGATKLLAVPTMASMAAPDLSTDIANVAAVELSCFVYADGWNPSATQARGTKRARLCQTTTRDSLNRATYVAPTIQYTYLPQELDSAPGNEAKELLVEGAVVYIIERIGVDADTAFAIGDHTITHHVRLGRQIRSGDRSDENAEFFITQETEYVTDPVEGVVVA